MKNELFAYLWLNLLKVLLHFAERANSTEFYDLIQCVEESIKRVLEILIESKALVENSDNEDKNKLWKTSWEIIGAFFTDMKQNVLFSQKKK
jgi:hypothetical protein